MSSPAVLDGPEELKAQADTAFRAGEYCSMCVLRLNRTHETAHAALCLAFRHHALCSTCGCDPMPNLAAQLEDDACAGDYTAAATAFSAALDSAPAGSSLRKTLAANLSAAHERRGDFAAALAAADTAVAAMPEWDRAYLRSKSMCAHRQLGSYEQNAQNLVCRMPTLHMTRSHVMLR